jgi:16S rRNA (guanine527-N7)-methyltransferase
MRPEFVSALESNKGVFGVEVSANSLDKLAEYYEFVQEHNPLLHLVAPCSPEEFAVRHVLESLTLLEHLPPNASFADVGAGAGLPSIPCLIVRGDLRGTLIESKEKKTRFLTSAINRLGLGDRAGVVNRQFEETSPGDSEFVTCRALDKFVEKLPRLLKWCGDRTLLFFGGTAVGDEMRECGLCVEELLMPLSERRFLYVAKK